MSTYFETDVLIVGGGPAGTSTALSLLKYSNLNVAIVEQGVLDQVRTGEQVNSSIFKLLDYIGIKNQHLNDYFIYGYSNFAAWGSPNLTARHSITTTEEGSLQLDRQTFDLHLLEKAAEQGAVVFPRTSCSHFEQLDNDEWIVEANHKTKGKLTFKARYLIDATGRQSHVAQKLGIQIQKDDDLVALGTFLEFPAATDIKQDTVIETVEDGWWYCATLPHQRMVLSLFTDASIAKNKRLQRPENLNRLLGQTKHIKQRLKGSNGAERPWIKPAFSKCIDITTRKHFWAVGDAMASFDPISSMGIGFAISSACNAAKALMEYDKAKEQVFIHHYQNNIHSIYQNYQRTKAQFYKQEMRWLESEFWIQKIKSDSLIYN